MNEIGKLSAGLLQKHPICIFLGSLLGGGSREVKNLHLTILFHILPHLQWAGTVKEKYLNLPQKMLLSSIDTKLNHV